MKVINPATVKVQLEKSFKAYSNCHATLTNYKNDRQIDIIKNGDQFIWHERGFQNLRKKNLTKAKVYQLIGKQINIEFSNSKKIHFFVK